MPSLGMRQDAHFPDINEMHPTPEGLETANAYMTDEAGIDNVDHYIDYNDRSYQMGIMDAILFSHVQMGKQN